MATTLLQLRDGAKELADLSDSGFVSDARWNLWINQGLKRLFALIATANPDHFFSEADFTLTASVVGARFTLPTGFAWLRGVTRQPGTSSRRSVRPFNFSERDQLNGNNPVSRFWCPRVRYRLMGGVMIMEPFEQCADVYRAYYVQRPTALAADIDTLPDTLELWSEFIEVFAALKAEGKEESDTGDLGTQLMLLRQDIEVAMSTRDMGEPEVVAQIEGGRNGWNGEW